MASAIIHLCVAKKVNERLGFDEKTLFLGTVAPDVSKQLRLSRNKSHFLTKDNNIDISKFLSKYEKFISKPYEMGYYIHLLTDSCWQDNFVTNFVGKDSITLLNGITIPLSDKDMVKLLYKDYTNTNVALLKKYEVDTSVFYDKFKKPKTKIKEISVDKLPVIIDKMKVIIENSKTDKTVLFDTKQINKFIDTTTDYIIEQIKLVDTKGTLIKE